MDATHIKQNFIVLSLHVLINDSGVPVAWKMVKATQRSSWKLLWQDLFRRVREVVPADWTVVVSADRGLYADWLFHEIVC